MLDNRTRERLTGAAILVAVIVLLVPELLSGPRRPAPQRVSAVDEAPVRSYTLSLGDVPQSSPPRLAEGTRSDWPGNSPAGVVDRAPPAAAVQRPATVVPPPAVAHPEPAHVLEAAHPAASAPPARRTAGGAEAHGRAGAASPGGAARKAPARDESAARGWAVQVGSFGSRENADRLVHSLKLKGYGAFVTESSSRGHKWYRVRVGPQRDRAAADAVAGRLRAAGLRGAVAQPR